jgi:hypothetical protein
MEIKSGSVVSKSGIKMTVRDVVGNTAICSWFIENELYRQSFNIDELEFISN